MSDSKTNELINKLVQIGCSEDFDNFEVLETTFPKINPAIFCHFQRIFGFELAIPFSEHEISGLIKALTRVEYLGGHYLSGSVSPVILLFRRLPESIRKVELADWVLNNTENDYLPFGTTNHGARSIAEYKEKCQIHSQNRQDRLVAEKERQMAAKARKAVVASERLFGAVKRRDRSAIIALLERGGSLSHRNESGQTVTEYAKSLGLDDWLNENLNEGN